MVVAAYEATRLVQNLHACRSLMQTATAAMQAVSTNESSANEAGILVLIYSNNIQDMLREIRSYACASELDWTGRWRAMDPAAATALQASISQYVASFGSFLTASAAAMQRLDAAIGDSVDQTTGPNERLTLFVFIWAFVYEASQWYGLSSLLLTAPSGINLTALQPILNTFMAWMLKLDRRGSAAQRELHSCASGRNLWQQTVWIHLYTANLLLCLLRQQNPFSAGLVAAVNSLPPGFIATLCCLACDSAPGPQEPGGHVDAAMLSRCVAEHANSICILGSTIGRLVCILDDVSPTAHLNPEVQGLNMLEFARHWMSLCYTAPGCMMGSTAFAHRTYSRILLAQPPSAAGITPPIILNCSPPHSSTAGAKLSSTRSTTTSSSSTGVSSSISSTSSTTSSSNSSNSSNNSSSSSTTSSSSDLVPRHLTSDQMLMSHLLECALADPGSLESSTSVMGSIISKWHNDNTLWSDPGVINSFATVLRHCSHHMLLVTKQQWHEQQRKRKLKLCRKAKMVPVAPPPSAEMMLQLQRLMVLTLILHACESTDAVKTLSVTHQLLAQEQLMRSSLAWRHVASWSSLPGCLAILELALRDQGSNQGRCDAFNAVHYALRVLLVQANNEPTPSSCAAHVSMLASVRKLLLLDATDPQHTASGSSTPGPSLTASQIEWIHKSLLKLLKAVLPRVAGSRTDSGALRMKGVPPSKTAAGKTHVSEKSTEAMHSIADGKQSSMVGGRTVESRALSESVEKGMCRIRAVTVMVLVWMSNCRVRLDKGEGMLPRGAEQHLGWTQAVRARDAELADVACQLLLPVQSAKWRTRSECFKREAATWDEFAIGNFYGRILPGCSNLGCMNMSGTSEVALETLLCSGCRHSRYCCLSCQKAAWLVGGHSSVCGKGKWCDGTTSKQTGSGF